MGVSVVAVLATVFLIVALIAWFIATLLGQQTITVVLIALVVGVWLLVARAAVRAIRGSAGAMSELIEAAGRLEAGEYGTTVGERGPRELRSLARAFNSMSVRMAATEEERRRLLADVSHELRTPLTVIQGSLEGMLDGLYPPDEAHLAPVLEETRVLSRLVDDLRTLSSAEAGSLSLHREPTDLGAVLADVAAAFRGQAEAAQISLSVDAGDDLPPGDVDPERIRQVLTNLAANALRYTPRDGSITISATRHVNGVEVRVADTGPGIRAEALPRVFERFYRTPDSRGSGLGLPIARGLVVAHGGDIEALSTPGGGTTIRFTLPVA